MSRIACSKFSSPYNLIGESSVRNIFLEGGHLVVYAILMKECFFKWEIFYDPTENKVFLDEMKRNLDPKINISELDTDINSPEFAYPVIAALRET